MTAVLELRVAVAAPAQAVWAGATDWARQGEWMIGTTVTPVRWRGRGAGARIVARTAIGPLAFVDPMEITRWDPPRVCHVRHLGTLVRGTGAFKVEPAGPDRSVFVWREELELPLGRLGALGWPLVRPVFALGVQQSLRALARWVEAGRPAPPTR